MQHTEKQAQSRAQARVTLRLLPGEKQGPKPSRTRLRYLARELQGTALSLVFLDTSQIDLLEKARRGDPLRYSSFRDTWKRRGCTLVLTLAQEGELRRYQDASRREGRHQVLADLAPIRRDVPSEYRPDEPHTLIAREIVRAMLERGLTTENAPSVDRLRAWTDVLPGRLILIQRQR